MEKGPRLVDQEEESMPEECIQELKAKDRKVLHCLVVVEPTTRIGQLIQCEHFSSAQRLFRATAYVLLAAEKFKKSKCRFLASSVSYLGYKLDGEGLHPLSEKVKAIQDAPTPRSVSELKSYLGILTYYAKFLPNLSTHLAPLYQLLCHDTKWKCFTAQQKAFEKSKKLLVSSKLLTHFDSNLPLVLACDASQYGVGAMLAHRLPDGSKRPIGYVSRTLNTAERNYLQLEKEGLACAVSPTELLNLICYVRISLRE